MNTNYDITDIVSVSGDYVRFCDGTMKPTTPDVLRAIIRGTEMSNAIYRYMMHDVIPANQISFRMTVAARWRHASDIAYQAKHLLYELTGEL